MMVYQILEVVLNNEQVSDIRDTGLFYCNRRKAEGKTKELDRGGRTATGKFHYVKSINVIE